MIQPSNDDVVYTWNIENVNHIIDTPFCSPEIQVPELGNGFWWLALYLNPPDSGSVQCGLQNTPLSTGLHVTKILYSFDLSDSDGRVFSRTQPRFGSFPQDNDLALTFHPSIDVLDFVGFTVRCRIRLLHGDRHINPLTLSAETEIEKTKVSQLVEVPADKTDFQTDICLNRLLTEGGEPQDENSEKTPVARILVQFDPENNSYRVVIINLIVSYPYVMTCLLSLLDTDCRVFHSNRQQLKYIFELNQIWELSYKIEESDLNDASKKLLNAKNRFVLRFDMQFSLGKTVCTQDKQPTSKPHIPGCESSLGDDLVRGYEMRKYCDWKLSYNPEEPPIPVHKCILASRSIFFKRMLEGDMLERNSEQVELRDIPDFSTLDCVLRFIYSNKAIFVDDRGNQMDYQMVFRVFGVADMYLLDDLKASCSEFLQMLITPENIEEFFEFINLYKDAGLERIVWKFYEDNKNKIKGKLISEGTPLSELVPPENPAMVE